MFRLLSVALIAQSAAHHSHPSGFRARSIKKVPGTHFMLVPVNKSAMRMQIAASFNHTPLSPIVFP
jgi:hypothetical protein